MSDLIVDDSICMEAYGRIIESLYSLPSQQNSTIFKLLSCLPATSIDIEERSDILQDLYNEVKQKMMNTNGNGDIGINWNQVLMNLQTLMRTLESNLIQAYVNDQPLDDMYDEYDDYPVKVPVNRNW